MALSSRDPEYQTWKNMIHRCTNENDPKWEFYGGAGVTVCERWTRNYGAFVADMGRKPTPFHTIDRIDNSRGYEPGNCRWATRAEQNANQRHQPRGEHVNRPSKTLSRQDRKATGHCVPTSITLSAADLDRLDAIKEALGWSRSAVIARAIHELDERLTKSTAA